MSDYEIRPPDASTWDAFAQLAEKHKGMAPLANETLLPGAAHLALRPAFSRMEPSAPAAAEPLVFDGDAAIAWCQFGSPEELPRIYHRKEWEAGLTGEPPA